MKYICKRYGTQTDFQPFLAGPNPTFQFYMDSDPGQFLDPTFKVHKLSVSYWHANGFGTCVGFV
jgi:hypothetical protein